MADEEHRIVHRITIHDDGSGAVDKVGGAFHRAAEHAHGLTERLGHFRREIGLSAPAMLGLGVGLGAWIEKTKEVNREFEKTNRMVSGLFATSLRWPKNTSFVERYTVASRLAAEQTEELEHIAARFGGSLGEVGEQYHQFATELSGLGLSREKMTELTTRVRATAKVLGVDAGQLIEKISTAALFGQIQKRGEAGKFLASIFGGKTALRGMGHEQILERINTAMGKLTPAADKMSQNIGDSLNRMHLAVDSIVRSLTGPLFTEIGKTLSDWARHLTEASNGARPLAEVYAAKLVTFFRELKAITEVLVKHWKEIAAIWAGAKIAGMMKGMGGAAGGLAGMVKGSGVPIVGALVGTAIEKTMGLMERRQEIGQMGGQMKGLLGSAQTFSSSGGFGMARDSGAMASSLKAQFQTLGISSFADYQDKIKNLYAGAVMTGDVSKSLGGRDTIDRLTGVLQDFVKQNQAMLFAGGDKDPTLTTAEGPTKFARQQVTNNFNGGIHIEQKFEDADPDRVFIRFKEDLEQQVIRPAVSPHANPFTG